MKIPLSWLNEYVPVVSEPEGVLEALLKVGFEEEAIHSSGLAGPIVVGRVLEFTEETHKNGKTVRWCQVKVAEDDIRGIVCGALNFFPDDLVVVTLPGAVLPGGFVISARKTYGHVSDGMIASERELGIGDDHDGILRLNEIGLTAKEGDDAISLLGLDEKAVEINVTPDRGYALSIRGVAREYAQATGQTFKDPADIPSLPPSRGFHVELTEPVNAFYTCLIRGVQPRPTPDWMKRRLELAGIRSISLVVDITNYVMLELGQPLHAYDFCQVDSGLEVRFAEPGEQLKTLDGKLRDLDPADLLIADASRALGLAGVMGGADSEISEDTADILLEAANFTPDLIAAAARRHQLFSEASRRFERGVDPLVAEKALARAARLIEELAGGHITTVGSAYLALTEGGAAETTVIDLPLEQVELLVGAPFDSAEVIEALQAVGAETVVNPTDQGLCLAVTPPSWRPDLLTAPDLVEEVIRLIGYDRIPALAIPTGKAAPPSALNANWKKRRLVGQVLAAAGHTEIICYPFVAAIDADSSVKLHNPLDATAAYLRQSLLPGLLEAAHRNLSRGLTSLSLFEIGRVFHGPVSAAPLPPGGVLPPPAVLDELWQAEVSQPYHAAVLQFGEAVEKQPYETGRAYDWADALEAARQIAYGLGVQFTFEQNIHPDFHPGRCAAVLWQGRLVGYAGQLLPDLALENNLPEVVTACEINLEAVAAQHPPVKHLLTTPAATQDLTLIVASDIPSAQVQAVVVEGAGPLLEAVSLIDDYRGDKVEPGKKALTFSMRFRSAAGTLTSEEATLAREAAVELAAARLQAVMRR